MKWHQCNNLDELQAFYESILPAIREAAKKCGYAVGVHGSMRRDLDLIAVPWIPTPRRGDAQILARPGTLAEAIQTAATGGISYEPNAIQWEKKPHGRIATSLPVCWANWPDAKDGTGHIDLSVMASV